MGCELRRGQLHEPIRRGSGPSQPAWVWGTTPGAAGNTPGESSPGSGLPGRTWTYQFAYFRAEAGPSRPPTNGGAQDSGGGRRLGAGGRRRGGAADRLGARRAGGAQRSARRAQRERKWRRWRPVSLRRAAVTALALTAAAGGAAWTPAAPVGASLQVSTPKWRCWPSTC